MDTQLLSSRQAAERLGITISTINRWVDKGKLKPIITVEGYRGARLFDADDIEHAGATNE